MQGVSRVLTSTIWMDIGECVNLKYSGYWARSGKSSKISEYRRPLDEDHRSVSHGMYTTTTFFYQTELTLTIDQYGFERF
jgi:hypothetical protein